MNQEGEEVRTGEQGGRDKREMGEGGHRQMDRHTEGKLFGVPTGLAGESFKDGRFSD